MKHTNRVLPMLWLAIASLVVLVALLVRAFPVSSQAALDAPGVDLLFLVDQSGSMGGAAAGSTAHPDANDRLGLRFEAPQDFVKLIAEDRVQNIHPGAIHRVALIDFGDQPAPRLGWTQIEPQSWDELRALISSLNSGDLAPGRYLTNNLGNTNFEAAFEQAAQVFAQLPSEDSNQRVRAIVVLTDGQPCVPPPATPTPLPDQPTPTPGYVAPCLSPTEHMARLQNYIRQQFPSEDYRIFTVAMNDSRDNYWDSMRGYWNTITGGRAQKIASNADVGPAFHSIWKELGAALPSGDGERTVISEPILPGPVVVPPYLDTISFTLFKKRPEETLEVRDAANQLLTGEMTDVDESGENIYKITVFRPKPGLWRVSTSGSSEDVDIEMRAVAAQGFLRSPTTSQVQYVPTTIEWQLLDSRGQPLPDYGDVQYRLNPSVTIRVNGETAGPVALDYKGDSTYAATFTPVQSGIHTIEMDASTKDLEGKDVVVFRGDVASFAVGGVSLQPVGLPFTHPQFTPLTLIYELRDPTGSPVSVRSGITVSATVRSGVNVWPLVLQPHTDGRFSADFVPVLGGAHEILVAATLRDDTGQLRSLAAGSGGAFNTVPPSVAIKSPVGAQAQHLPMTISYQVLDGLSEQLKLAPGYQMVFTGTLRTAGQADVPLTLQPADSTTFAATYTPSAQGAYELSTSARVQGPDGRRYPVFTDDLSISVVPTTRLRLDLAHPGPDEQHQYIRKLALRPAGLFSAPTPLVVEVRLLDESGAAADPRTVLDSAPAVPLRLSVVDTDSKEDFSGRFVLATTGVPGVYRAEAEGLPIGRYDIVAVLAPDVRTQPAYVITEAERTAQNTVRLTENPFWVGLLAAIVLAIVGLITFVLLRKQRAKRLSKHPARGTLQIENEFAAPIFTKVLATVNHQVLTDFPPATHIKKLEVKCSNDNDSKLGRVQVTAVLDNNTKATGALAPSGGRMPLGAYKVYIRKIN